VTASVMSAAKLSSVGRERCLFFISFMAEKDCSHCITIRLSYPTLILWVAVQNTNRVKIKYVRPKILAGHLVGSRGPQFGNHWTMATCWP